MVAKLHRLTLSPSQSLKRFFSLTNCVFYLASAPTQFLESGMCKSTPKLFLGALKTINAICFHRMCFQTSYVKQIRTGDLLNRCCSQRIQLLQAVLTRYVRLKMVVMSDYPRSSPQCKVVDLSTALTAEFSSFSRRRPNIAGGLPDAPEPTGSGRFPHTGPRHVLLTAQMWVDTAPPAQHQPIMSLYKVLQCIWL